MAFYKSGYLTLTKTSANSGSQNCAVMEYKICDKAEQCRLKLSHHQSTQWQLYLLFFIILKLKNSLQGIKTLIYELLLDQ